MARASRTLAQRANAPTLLSGITVIVSGALLLAGSGAGARAQGETGPAPAPPGAIALDVIEVTARRSEEPLTNVPVSVGLVLPREIAMEAPTNAAVDISRNVPNYSVTDVGNPLFAFGAIRGIGTLSFPQNPFDSTIGYALGGSPISMYAGSQQLLDVARVEVLRGPQNVLFGRSSEGGTVNIVPAEADGVRDIRVRGEVGSNGNYLTDLIVGGTIVPGVVNGRAAVRFVGNHGDVTNLIGGQALPSNEIGAARGALRFFLGERTTVTVSGFYERNRSDTFNYILRDGPGYPATALDAPLGFKRNLALGNIEVKHEFDSFDLTGTFGVQNIQAKMRSDNTDGLIYSQLIGLPFGAFSSPTCSDCTRYSFDERVYSGEIRASSKPNAPLRWIAGLSMYSSRFDQGGVNRSSFGPTQNGLYDAKLKLDSYSAFAEAGIPLDERWTLTPGVRLGYDTISRAGSYLSNGAAGTVPSFNEFGKVSDPFVAGGATLSYKPNEGSLLYGSVKRGYSSAGFPYFNIYSVFGQPAPSYPASYAWTYELGGRTTVLDDRVSLDGAVFYNDVSDGHVNSFDLLANTFVIAALDYRTYGFELSTRAKIADGWSAYGKLGYVHATFANVPVADTTGARNGARLPGVPTWSGVVGLENRLALEPYGLKGNLVSSAELQFVGGPRTADIANTFDLRPYRIVNARFGWEGESFKVYGFARNLFDASIELAGTAFSPQVLAVTPGLGRVIGIGAEMSF
ncbi:TonB-dependent receptor [Chelatococcus reniformis]|uniref:TonB-dependent receptor n=1 Tax=Chelatococcus reniformis TaxID=1494448 RepID=A0A916U893_9HYPH|nr:TonB-dependent receptor [Chelatococcus reniformis]GGC63125.1 TonB-dependent receptor [Chelatococcus reniformis]